MQIQLLILILALIGSAFYSGTETALISINKMRLQGWQEQEKGGRLGWLAGKYMQQPGDILSVLLAGNNLMNIIATVALADMVFQKQDLSIIVTALAIPALLTPPVLLFGELIPKTIGREHAARLLPLLAVPLEISYYVMLPVARVTLWLSWLLLAMLGVKRPKKEELFTRKNVRRVLDEIELEGTVEVEEHEYISGVFDFSQTMVREVMTPRTEVAAANKESTIEEIAGKMYESNFSRIPIYEDSLDHIIGTMHVMDMVVEKGVEKPRIHPVIFAPETRKCDSLLLEMRQRKCHLAVVLDEYGGTAGIITLEDLMEELVGDIHDMHDSGGALITVGRDRSVVVDGRARFEELEDKIELPGTQYEVETIGGLLVTELGRIPEAGERFQLGAVQITVLEASAKRVERLRLKHVDLPGEGDGEAGDGQIRPLST